MHDAQWQIMHDATPNHNQGLQIHRLPTLKGSKERSKKSNLMLRTQLMKVFL